VSATEPDTPLPSYDERVLLLAPTRRDRDVTCRALASAGVACSACDSVAALAHTLDGGVGALMLTDLVLIDPDLRLLHEALARQPAWSDIPTVLMCRDREQSALVRRGMDRLRNVTLLDRPASMRSMVSAVHAALRGRRWQYQIRDQLVRQRHAEDALRKADQRKDEFLATLAHELRNPLAPIRTGLQVLRKLPGDSPGSGRVFAMMDRQLSQLVKLIDELLDVSRIATGKVVLQRELVDMRTVVQVAVESSQPMIDAAGHRLQLQLPAQEVRVIGDLSRLAQAVGNLLNNAAKYTPAGGRIAVTLGQADGEAVVNVADNGVGIPPDMLARVFDLFAQVDRTLDRAQGGLGIGLSLVRSLMTLHGGGVSVHSDGADRGSRFTLRLPSVPIEDRAPPQPLTGNPSHAPPRRTRRILVVDDNTDAADSLAMLLNLHGHRTQVEYSASAALLAAQEFTPDAIFCDLGMPGMGGHEFAARLRRDRRFVATLLVAVTGWGGEEDQRLSRAAGFDAHLTKPVELDAVEQVMARR
jgi:two-component system, sensor histidine kinase